MKSQQDFTKPSKPDGHVREGLPQHGRQETADLICVYEKL